MKKLRRISACLFALVMVFTLLASSLVNVYAVGIPPDPVASETEEADPESTSGETPDSSLPPDDSDTPPDDSSAPPDDSSVPPEDNSDPSDGSDAEEPDDTSEEPEAPAEEEPAFVPLEIVGFIPELTAEFGQ